MVVATACFSAMHATVRFAAEGLHPFEVAFFRNLFGLLVIVPVLAARGLAPLRTGRFGLHLLRAGLNVVAMLAFFTALTIAPLAEVQSLGFTAPLFATALAALALGERVGASRWVAGGTDLLPNMRRGLVRNKTLIDLSRIEELSHIRADEAGVHLGASVTLADDDARALSDGTLAPVDAFLGGKVKLSGDTGLLLKLPSLAFSAVGF